jgi:hypothetical protein
MNRQNLMGQSQPAAASLMDGVDATGIGSQIASLTYGPSTNCLVRASEAELLLGRDVGLHLADAADPRIVDTPTIPSA